MLTWHVGKTFCIYRDGVKIAEIHPDNYAKLVADMAREVSHRWDGVRRDADETAS